MSRFEGMPLLIPEGVDVDLKKDDFGRVVVSVKGAKGSLVQDLLEGVECERKDNSLFFTVDEKNKKNFVGLYYRLILNHLEGVVRGFQKILEINGVGYKWSVANNVLQLQVGFSHPVSYTPPKDVTLTVDAKNALVVEGIDKQKVGSVAAEIKMFRPVEPYKGKGISYRGQYVIRKAGKASGK